MRYKTTNQEWKRKIGGKGHNSSCDALAMETGQINKYTHRPTDGQADSQMTDTGIS